MKDKLTPYNASHCKDPTAYEALSEIECKKRFLTPSGIPKNVAYAGVRQEDTKMQELTTQERRILAIIRKTDYGEITIKVRDSKPTLVTKSETIKLD